MLKNLKAEMVRSDISVKQIAKAINKDEKSVRNKINGLTALTFPEAIKIQSNFFPKLEMKYLFWDSEIQVNQESNLVNGLQNVAI